MLGTIIQDFYLREKPEVYHLVDLVQQSLGVFSPRPLIEPASLPFVNGDISIRHANGYLEYQK